MRVATMRDGQVYTGPRTGSFFRVPQASPLFLLVCALAVAALQGCVSLAARGGAPLGYSEPEDGLRSIRTLGPDHRYSQVTSREVARRLETRAAGRPIDVLALSGGGAGGAFGAGAVVGLTRSGARPQFAVVTGVSAGALIAPYAFLGAAWDPRLAEIYAGRTGEHVLQSRGLGAIFGSSLYRGAPLKELVDRYATDELIQAIAREAAGGRLLLVATTDVNTGEPVLWDLGSIAMYGGSDARTLFRDVLVASASVPGMFPPVVLRIAEGGGQHSETHVDGGVTLPFFIAPSPADMVGNFADGARGKEPGGVRLYVIVDGQLGEHPRATRLKTTSIVSRSVAAGLNGMLRTTLELTAATAQQRGISLDYAAIPVSYPYRGAFDFSGATLGPLFQYAYECASAGRLWTAFQPTADVAAEAAESSAPAPGAAGLGAAAAACPADDAFIERFAERRH